MEKLAQDHRVSNQTSHRPGALVPPLPKGSHGPSGHMGCRGQAGVRGWALLCLLSRPADTCKVRNFWECGGGRRLEQPGCLRVDPLRPPCQPLGPSLILLPGALNVWVLSCLHPSSWSHLPSHFNRDGGRGGGLVE